ncbi:hypothetical protein LWI28_028393 [Acer negundo]|uniref:Uncharacterized protein n=1 Tax=Acer negundo TaxID=4023 RepID=A0AAD5IXU1_ACENE|nr:hypothetical protein LWI28_028393 [Acer negundo]KAK4843314.1 hypothetical protein QYF36_006659 [Acer negundo]
MGEIDTKPIEPVQVALSLFDKKADLTRHRSTTSCSDFENEKEREFEGLLKNLANYKVQLESKDSAYRQALLKLEYNQNIAQQLSTLLNESEAEREKYIVEYTKATTHIDEVELKLKEMADQLSETCNIREQLLHVFNELKAAQDDLFSAETELAFTRDLQFKAMTEAQLMESAANIEKEKAQELLRHVLELKEDVLKSKLSEIDSEIEDLKNQLEIMEELENQFLFRSIFADFLELELKQSNELLNSSKIATSGVQNDLKQLKAEMEEVKKRESEAQIEVALLKSELHRGRSKIAAAEAAEARVKSVNSGLYRAVQELAVEAEKVKMENQRLKQGDDKIVEFEFINNPQADYKSETKYDAHITISIEEYESLIEKAEKTDQILVSSSVKDCDKSEYEYGLQKLKKELEVTMAKIGEFRSRAEQAITRAELAEKAKATLEDRLRRSQQRKETRKAALATLRQECAPKERSFPTYEKLPATYQPLGKVLNMKF